MTKQIVKKKTINNNIEVTSKRKLSIQFSLDGFSFCVINSKTKEALYFKKYQFEGTLNSPEDLLKKIEAIFKKDTNLQLTYSKVTVIHQNNLSTFVPSKYFDENSLGLAAAIEIDAATPGWHDP